MGRRSPGPVARLVSAMNYKPVHLLLGLILVWTLILVFVISRFYFSACAQFELLVQGCGGSDSDSESATEYAVFQIPPPHSPFSKFNTAIATLEAEDAKLGQNQPGRVCSQEFGVDMLERWRRTQVDVCNGFRDQSHIRCYRREPYSAPRILCTASNALIRMHSPYYELEVHEGRDSEEMHFEGAILNVDCGLGMYHAMPSEWWSRQGNRNPSVATFMDTIAVQKSLSCTQTVNHTVFWMMRYDHKNLFHVMEDVVTTYETLLMLNEDPANVELAIYDGFPYKNALFDIWGQIFGVGVRIVRENPYPVGTCFNRSVFNMLGSPSHFSNGMGVKGWIRCPSPILKSMIHWIKSMFQAPEAVPTDSGPQNILWISRKNYANRTIGRVIPNEDEILGYVRKRLPANWTLDTFRPELMTTMQQQVSIMSTTRIFIGVHGAGLANLMFMPNHARSHVIEIFHSDRGPINKHYVNICKWLGITYHDAGYFMRQIPPKAVWSIVKEILDTESANSRETTATVSSGEIPVI